MKAHVNLLVSEVSGRERFPFQKVLLPAAFLVLILSILGGTMVEKRRSQALQQEIAAIHQRKAAIALSLETLKVERGEILRQAESVARPDQTKEQLLRQLEQKRRDWSSLLREVSLVVPDQVWLVRLEGAANPGSQGTSSEGMPKELRLSGFAVSHPDIARLISALEISQKFYQVKLVVAEKKIENGKARVNFEIKAFLKT